jgi:hypothetical protein
VTDPIDKKRNQITPIYALGTALLLIFLSAVNELDMALNLWILMIPFMLIPTIIVFIWLVVALVVHALWRRWRRVASILLGPPIGLACVMMALEAGFDATWMRFEATKSRYVRELEQAASPTYKVWQWGETGGVGTAQQFYTLVYDESDAVAKREGLGASDSASPAVLSDAVVENSGEPSVSVRHLEGHFYLVCELYN